MPADAPNAVRSAKNENIFRELNEHLVAATTPVEEGAGAFVCECSSISCAEIVTLSFDEYTRVRRESDRFLVAPSDSHVDSVHERVVERLPSHWVVEKIGLAGKVAEQLDES